ncbi:DNA/RNA non-specific endonuclease [Streptomyces sp. MS1.AVA.3]|uniref:DNA/RNA non-specific endonuclease n=1 Tax=Streptomyces decoyicus TaxID=249567 RepID=UPI0030C3F291
MQSGEPNPLGRSTTMHATITRDMIGEGTHAASRIKPRGFQGGPPAGPHARGHLLGRQLGGSGDIGENLVTLVHRPVNTPNMARLEGQIRRAAEGGEAIQYTVKPIYDGNNLVPRGVTLEAHGPNGFRFHSRDGSEFNSITLLNRSK